jgi:MFS transporter, DHA1 family, multidrug resistance protein
MRPRRWCSSRSRDGLAGLAVGQLVAGPLSDGLGRKRPLLAGVAPVLAPVIGGQVLRFTSWRGVFGVPAAIGLVLPAASWFLPERLPPERRTRSRLRGWRPTRGR